MKKKYMKPEMKAIAINIEQTILTGSNTPQTCGLLGDEDDWD